MTQDQRDASTLPEGADEYVSYDTPAGAEHYTDDGRLKKRFYESELAQLQEELVKLQYWVVQEGLRVAIIFEGRGTAGKGGVIKRITERTSARIVRVTSARIVRVAALPKPTERELTQWYFQRYVSHLPAAGEIVLFDRSWYNRSNVEWVMGFCTDDEHEEFLRSCPEFERMLVRSGITVLKYWFSVGYDEQRKRFESRNREPLKRWKLSDMDLEDTCAIRWPRTPPSSSRTSSRHPGTWFRPITRGGHGSTA